ncbi:hypothetical protein C0993_012084 [Termitomyces sp. T159_Od127]|nr:hypothetical protein C0993_012084 [Termitomyces sp. T159_Od127]
MSRSDLKQVSAIFDACIAQIRSKPSENFDKAAEQYIKDARVTVMKKFEQHFEEIAQNADNPQLLPYWAINPSVPLEIITPYHSRQLDSYIPTFTSEYQTLMDECGFNAVVKASTWFETRAETGYIIAITFATTAPRDSTTTHFTSCFPSLPKFSAAVLKITQDIEEPVVPELNASTPARRGARRTRGKESARTSARSVSGTALTLKRKRGSKKAGDTSTRTSKRLQRSASVPEDCPDKVDGPRRSKRLRNL